MQTTSLSGLTQSLLGGNGRGWLPIDTDYLFYLQAHNSQRIVALTQIGVKANLEMAGTMKRIEARIETGLNSIAHQIHAQTNTLTNTNRILKDILHTLENPRAIEAAEKARIAAQNMKEAQSMSETRANRLLDEAFDLLQESLEIHRFDYKANFDLAWLWQYYKEDLIEAETCYDNAVLRSLKKDPDFAVFALRHLASVQRERGNIDGAMESLKEAHELQKGERDLTQFEYAHALILNHQSKEAASLIKALVGRNDDYYSLTAVNPVLAEDEEVDSLLDSLYSKRLQDVKKYIMNREGGLNRWFTGTKYIFRYKFLKVREKEKTGTLTVDQLWGIERRIKAYVDKNVDAQSYSQLEEVKKMDDFWRNQTAGIRRKYLERLLHQEIGDKLIDIPHILW